MLSGITFFDCYGLVTPQYLIQLTVVFNCSPSLPGVGQIACNSLVHASLRILYYAIVAALTSAAVHWSCCTAQLYEQQISLGEIAVVQACCEASLQSSTEQWERYSALTSAAVHWCCSTAQLYGQQISIGAIAVAQACCGANLQSSTEQWESYSALTSAAVHWCCITAHLLEQDPQRFSFSGTGLL